MTYHKGQVVPWTDAITCVDVAQRLRDKLCRACETPLAGRRTAYCSDECSKAFDREHFWNVASGRALKAARIDGDWRHRCAHCGGAFEAVEVNHIEPVRGGPRFATCLNHAVNLEVLCHACHLLETERQFRPAKAALRERGA